MSYQNRIKAINLFTLPGAGFNNTLQQIITGLPAACVILRIVNGTNMEVGVSYDGVNVSDAILSGGTLQLDFQANSLPSAYAAMIAKGTSIYIIGTVAGTGFVYLAAYYLPEV